MCWPYAAVLLSPSVAFQVRSIATPQPAVVPTSVWLIVTAPPQLSVAVAVPVLLGSAESPHWSCLSGGQVITGGVVSTTGMCCTQVAVLLHPSAAFQGRS